MCGREQDQECAAINHSLSLSVQNLHTRKVFRPGQNHLYKPGRNGNPLGNISRQLKLWCTGTCGYKPQSLTSCVRMDNRLWIVASKTEPLQNVPVEIYFWLVCCWLSPVSKHTVHVYSILQRINKWKQQALFVGPPCWKLAFRIYFDYKRSFPTKYTKYENLIIIKIYYTLIGNICLNSCSSVVQTGLLDLKSVAETLQYNAISFL